MQDRICLSLCLLLALALVPGSTRAATPNIVLILADDMGYGDVQALSPASKIATPNLDRLANEGVLFTDAHSPSAVCTPTRYALLTGRYAWRTRLKSGVLGGYSTPLLETERSTIADMLRAKGYRTGAVGKWHLGMDMPFLDEAKKAKKKQPWGGDPGIDFRGVISNSPIHHGFDEYFGVSASLDMAPYVYIRKDRFVRVPTLEQPAVRFPHFVRRGPRSVDFVIDKVLDKLAEESVRFLRESAKLDKPFFLYLPLTGPHKPTQPHERFRGRTGLGEYGDFVAQVDWTVGEVLKALDETGKAKDTLVIYSSDNGSYMNRIEKSAKQQKDHVEDERQQGYFAENHRANGPLRGTKADIWEAGHRVPLMIRWPGRVEPGTRSSKTVCLTDVYATCAEIVGSELRESEAEDSFSMLALLEDEKAVRGAPVIHHSVGGMFAIREGRWKLVLGNGSGGREKPRGKPFAKPYQLFDLEKDLGEATDLAKDRPEIVERLSAACEAIREKGRSR